MIHPCVEIAPFLALKPAIDGPVRRFAMLGRLDVQKGFDVALAGFRAAAGTEDRLEIVGEGPERERLERMAAGDARIRFAGWRDPAEALAEVDAVLMPSRWEAFGLVALEAQAAGRLVLVSNADGLADHVPHGATMVAPLTPEAWAAAIARARTEDPTSAVLRGRFRARGAERLFARRWAALVGMARVEPVPQPVAV
jgi:glycosyltransferase involved in cell wall biosynthesis